MRNYSGIELLKNVREEDIEDMTTRYIPMFTEERDSDVVKRVRLSNGECAYMIALIEHKSTVDYNVTMQLLRYMVYIWEDYEKEQEKLPEGYLDGISKMSSPDVLEVISRVVATMLRRRNISEDKIADLTDGIRRKPMGQLFKKKGGTGLDNI